jgi:hypothetical protein
MRGQLRSMGAMWAWDREAITCLPEYYKWTQWFFLKFFEKGLAYRKKRSPVDFCPHCNTTLAREQVWGDDRHCERCGTPVIKKDLEQWFFRITDYAEELLKAWRRSSGPSASRRCSATGSGEARARASCFAPSGGRHRGVHHPARYPVGGDFYGSGPRAPAGGQAHRRRAPRQVEEYRLQASRQSEIERLSTEKEKTGVFIGAYAINPVNDARIPIWIADYVMMGYGTGAIMAVPAHDERDFQFALKFGLPIVPVIDRTDGLAKSVVFPRTVRDMGALGEALRAAGITCDLAPVGDLGEGLFVTLHGNEQIDRYIALVRQALVPGNWNEIVGARFAFIFDDGVRLFDSVASGEEILARCKALYPPVSGFRTTMEALYAVPFYRDVLYHAEPGTMINSGPFTGTPGDRAKAEVIAWLEEQGSARPR